MRKRDRTRGRARIQLHADRVPGPQHVLLGVGPRNDQVLRRAVAQTGLDGPRRPLLDGHVHVDLVLASRNGRRLDFDLLEEAKAIDPVARELDLFRIEPARLELPDLAPNHFIARAGVAGDVHMPHVRTPSRIDQDRKCHLALFLVGFRHRVGVGEGISQHAEAIRHRLGDRVDPFPVVDLSRLHVDQL